MVPRVVAGLVPGGTPATTPGTGMLPQTSVFSVVVNSVDGPAVAGSGCCRIDEAGQYARGFGLANAFQSLPYFAPPPCLCALVVRKKLPDGFWCRSKSALHPHRCTTGIRPR
jgi:hypothetical protein